MKVLFSKLSVYKLEKLCEYLVEEFSENSKKRFLEKLNSRVQTIVENPQIYPTSTIDHKIRKCVITKHSILLYEIQSDCIHILNLIDSRQDKNAIHEEILKHFS
ncbi:MAG: type II toxin-antitoxin system RelE/ParE family toxin [Balneolaceae bacterium]|nr:type II toxin-antitoxin system RelE/ParE family toxin [Balneolaceae bacterium]